MGQKNYKTDVNEAMEVLILNQQVKTKGVRQDKQKDKEPDARSFAQNNNEEQSRFRCFKCGRKTCKGNNQCTHKNKPKSEWACMKAMDYADSHSRNSFAQPSTISEDDNNSAVSSITESQSHHNDSRVQESVQNNDDLPAWFHFMDTHEWEDSCIFQNNSSLQKWMKLVIILDNQSSASLFSNKELVQKIMQGNKTLRVYTNAGSMKTSMTPEVPAFGKVWFDERAIANILAWIQIRDHPDYTITYDYDKDEFVVQHTPTKKKIVFFRYNGHYVYVPTRYKIELKMVGSTSKNVVGILHQNTVEERMKSYTQCQVAEARKAVELLKSVGLQSWKDLIR